MRAKPMSPGLSGALLFVHMCGLTLPLNAAALDVGALLGEALVDLAKARPPRNATTMDDVHVFSATACYSFTVWLF